MLSGKDSTIHLSDYQTMKRHLFAADDTLSLVKDLYPRFLIYADTKMSQSVFCIRFLTEIVTFYKSNYSTCTLSTLEELMPYFVRAMVVDALSVDQIFGILELSEPQSPLYEEPFLIPQNTITIFFRQKDS